MNTDTTLFISSTYIRIVCIRADDKTVVCRLNVQRRRGEGAGASSRCRSDKVQM